MFLFIFIQLTFLGRWRWQDLKLSLSVTITYLIQINIQITLNKYNKISLKPKQKQVNILIQTLIYMFNLVRLKEANLNSGFNDNINTRGNQDPTQSHSQHSQSPVHPPACPIHLWLLHFQPHETRVRQCHR